MPVATEAKIILLRRVNTGAISCQAGRGAQQLNKPWEDFTKGEYRFSLKPVAQVN